MDPLLYTSGLAAAPPTDPEVIRANPPAGTMVDAPARSVVPSS
ncbi:hypothetical protein [Paraliomyxa miuraensis]|nr:hypothetical protein [Paraliomyxa miuraensis]MCX4243792.1 hypothetical protein [Paraliomyxa miuraensis]